MKEKDEVIMIMEGKLKQIDQKYAKKLSKVGTKKDET